MHLLTLAKSLDRYGEPGASVVRAVVHQHVSSDDVAFVVDAIRSVMRDAPTKSK